MISRRIILFVIATLPLIVTPSANQTDWSILETSLSDSALHGPLTNENYDSCQVTREQTGTVSDSLYGICMNSQACGYNFCDPDHYTYNLPSYSLEVKSESDLMKAMIFASAHDIPVSVKTTGHSLQGSSTQHNSLLIWMYNFKKDGEIKENYNDSCGNVHDVVGIGGGETWNDVHEAVKDKYNFVSPNDKTVSAAGGWLQGGGASYNSRLYGLGIDNVVDFRVVLSDGSLVIANKCTNPDLFWALRGGGGGTYGVVTHIHYKVHQVTPIVQVNFVIYGRENLDVIDYKPYSRAIFQWLDFWIRKSQILDKRWCGGHFSQNYVHLLFCGSVQDAKETFLTDFIQWEDIVLRKAGMREGVWGSLFATAVYGSWYKYYQADRDVLAGIASGIVGLDMDAEYTHEAYTSGDNISVRLIPEAKVLSNYFGMLQLLMHSDVVNSSFGLPNYFLGGAINDVPVEETSIHPAMRSSIYTFKTSGDTASNLIRNVIPNTDTGVEYNYHNVIEPDWRNACWGSNYDRLYELKGIFDSNHLFNCWHCVGFIGIEVPERITSSPTSSPSQQPSMPPSKQPSPSPSLFPTVAPTDSASDIPSTSPSLSPTAAPTNYPSNVPSLSNNPSMSLAPSCTPFIFPSQVPTVSIHPSTTPTNIRSEIPSISSLPSIIPSTLPSNKPSISMSPSSIPSNSPSENPSASPSLVPSIPPVVLPKQENPYARFILKRKWVAEGVSFDIVRRCKWLAKKPFSVKQRYCSGLRYQLYSEEEELGPASRTCFDTCAPFCVKEVDSAQFILKSRLKDDGQIELTMRQCQWIRKRDDVIKIAKICANKVDYDGYVFGQASEVCTDICQSCDPTDTLENLHHATIEPTKEPGINKKTKEPKKPKKSKKEKAPKSTKKPQKTKEPKEPKEPKKPKKTKAPKKTKNHKSTKEPKKSKKTKSPKTAKAHTKQTIFSKDTI